MVLDGLSVDAQTIYAIIVTPVRKPDLALLFPNLPALLRLWASQDGDGRQAGAWDRISR